MGLLQPQGCKQRPWDVHLDQEVLAKFGPAYFLGEFAFAPDMSRALFATKLNNFHILVRYWDRKRDLEGSIDIDIASAFPSWSSDGRKSRISQPMTQPSLRPRTTLSGSCKLSAVMMNLESSQNWLIRAWSPGSKILTA